MGSCQRRKELMISNNKIQYGFDNDTVFLTIKTNENLIPSLSLSYESPLWDTLSDENVQNGMADDI